MRRWILLAVGIVAVLIIGIGVAAQSGRSLDTFLPGHSEDDPSELSGVADDVVDTAQPSVNLDHPSEADWEFLREIMRSGSKEAKQSAARILVEISQVAGAEILFDTSITESEDSDLFCLSALEILRVQQRADTIVAIWSALGRSSPALSARCRGELEDRAILVGSDDPRHVRALWRHPSEEVRLRVVEVLGQMPEAYMDVLQQMSDSDASVSVREHASAVLAR